MVFQEVARFNSVVHGRRFPVIQRIKTDMRFIFDKSVRAVQPDNLLRNSIHVKGNKLVVNDAQYQLNKNVYLIGFGKAALGMACEAERMFGNHLCSGIISVPDGIQETLKDPNMQPKPDSTLEIIEGAKNNLPDQNAEEAARRIKQLVQNLGSNALLIALISGGGSSLLPLPVPPITLEEKCQMIKLLTAAGANIIELNSVRKKLSLLKGGGLAQLAYPAQVLALIISDIVGDPLDLIASGPTVVNSDAPDVALNIIRKYSLLDKVPASIHTCLSTMSSNITNQHEEFENSKIFSHVRNLLIGSNLTAVTAAAEAATSNNYNTVILSSGIEGLVADVGRMYATLATTICKMLCNKSTPNETHEVFCYMKQLYRICDNSERELLCAVKSMKNKRGICLIAGGETTVIVKGGGLGGRNQELAMIFARHMNENSKSFPFLEQFHAVLLSAGSDGIDGPTNAAGAFGYREQLNAATEQNLKLDEYESNNDSYNFYLNLNGGEDLIVIGHTGTNVMDVHVLVIEPIENNW